MHHIHSGIGNVISTVSVFCRKNEIAVAGSCGKMVAGVTRAIAFGSAVR
jgi:hypothetical protein